MWLVNKKSEPKTKLITKIHRFDQRSNESKVNHSKRIFELNKIDQRNQIPNKNWSKVCKITHKIEEPTESEDEFGIREQFFWLVMLLNGARFFVIVAIGFTEFSDEDGAWRFAIDDFVDEENEGRRFWWMFDIF